MIIDKQEIEERLLYVLNAELKRIQSEANGFHSDVSFSIEVMDHGVSSWQIRNANEGKYDRDYLNDKFGGHVKTIHKMNLKLELSYRQEELTIGPNKRW